MKRGSGPQALHRRARLAGFLVAIPCDAFLSGEGTFLGLFDNVGRTEEELPCKDGKLIHLASCALLTIPSLP